MNKGRRDLPKWTEERRRKTVESLRKTMKLEYQLHPENFGRLDRTGLEPPNKGVPISESQRLAIQRKTRSIESIAKGIAKFRWHENRVESQSKILKDQGFKVFPITNSSKKPDIIAMKDGKVIAVEITSNRRPKYQKWFDKGDFDDIVWIVENQN